MKKNHVILSFIFSFTIVIVVMGSFLLILNVIKNKNQHTSAIFYALQQKMTDKEKIDNSKEKIQEMKLLQDKIDQYFVDPNQIDKFVGYLEDIGATIGSEVSVKGIDISKKENNLVSFKLSTRGTFQEIMKTITFLENIPYQIKITQVYLNKDLNKDIPIEKTKIPTDFTWQADISFDILKLN